MVNQLREVPRAEVTEKVIATVREHQPVTSSAPQPPLPQTHTPHLIDPHPSQSHSSTPPTSTLPPTAAPPTKSRSPDKFDKRPVSRPRSPRRTRHSAKQTITPSGQASSSVAAPSESSGYSHQIQEPTSPLSIKTSFAQEPIYRLFHSTFTTWSFAKSQNLFDFQCKLPSSFPITVKTQGLLCPSPTLLISFTTTYNSLYQSKLPLAIMGFLPLPFRR